MSNEDSPATVCPLGRGDFLSALEERERRATFARMKSRPFGFDSQGKPFAQVSGKLVKSAVTMLRTCVAERVTAESADAADLPERIARAQEETVAQLVARLNDAIGDPGYHVTPESLLVEGSRYSREFELFVNVFCQELSRDRRFFWRRGAASIPASMATLMKPLTVRGVFEVVPRATTRFVDTDVRVLETTRTSAILQWYSQKQQDGLPPELRSDWLQMSCPAFCGAFASIPSKIHEGQPSTRVETRRCQRQGSECCEWRFSWSNPTSRSSRGLVLGGAASAGLLALAATRLPGTEAALLVALLPLFLGWHGRQLQAQREESDRRDAVVAELRDLAETLQTEKDAAEAASQLAQLTSDRSSASLATAERVSLALASRFERDSLLRQGLAGLVEGGLVDRALVLLLEEEKRVLYGGPSLGGNADLGTRVRQLKEPVEGSGFERVLESPTPVLLDVETVRRTPLGSFWPTLATRELLAAPIRIRGRTLGILLADDTTSGRPLGEEETRIVGVVAALLAVGIDLARLRSTIDAEREKTWPGTSAPSGP